MKAGDKKDKGKKKENKPAAQARKNSRLLLTVLKKSEIEIPDLESEATERPASRGCFCCKTEKSKGDIGVNTPAARSNSRELNPSIPRATVPEYYEVECIINIGDRLIPLRITCRPCTKSAYALVDYPKVKAIYEFAEPILLAHAGTSPT